MPMNPRLLVPRAAAGPPLLLDIYKDAACAYSLRLIRRAYKGPVVRVRSTGAGSPEADFTAREIASGALASFVGAGNDGHVRTWYDQSGNARHANQATAGAQPKIVSGGSLIVDGGGKPVVSFDGNDSLVGSVISAAFILHVLKYASSASVFNALSTRVASNAGFSFDNQLDVHFCRAFGTTSQAGVSANGGTTTQNLIAFRAVNASLQVWRNGVAGGPGGGGSSTTNIGYVAQSTQALSIGARTGGSGGVDFQGEFSEIIIYPTDQTSVRTNLEADIMGYYGL